MKSKKVFLPIFFMALMCTQNIFAVRSDVEMAIRSAVTSDDVLRFKMVVEDYDVTNQELSDIFSVDDFMDCIGRGYVDIVEHLISLNLINYKNMILDRVNMENGLGHAIRSEVPEMVDLIIDHLALSKTDLKRENDLGLPALHLSVQFPGDYGCITEAIARRLEPADFGDRANGLTALEQAMQRDSEDAKQILFKYWDVNILGQI